MKKLFFALCLLSSTMIIDAQNAIKELYPYVPSQMGISVSQVMKGMSSYTEWDKIQLDEQNTLLEYYGASELFSVRFFFENGDFI